MTKIFIFSILPSIFFSYKVVDKARLSLYYYDRRKISSVNRVFLRLTIKKGGVFVKIAGIIAEYNPFHNGHRVHIEKTRAAGFTHIAVVMSGPFVQRGEPAILDKWTRARTAVEYGADLVIELPAVYALSSASDFARGAVFLLRESGAETLSFGSECGDAALLADQASRLSAVEASDAMQSFLKKGMSFPRARQAAMGSRLRRIPCFYESKRPACS